MGEAPDGEVGPGAAMAIPTGGLLPHGADAVVMVEHTTEPMPGHVEIARRARARRRRAAPRGGGRAGRRARPGRPPAARRRPRAARGRGDHRARRARAAAGGDRLDRRRGRARRRRRRSRPGRCATRARPRSPGWCARRAGSRVLRGIVPDDAAALERVLGEAVAAGRPRRRLRGLLGRRARPHGRGRRRGWARSSATGWPLRPGKPTLLADCGGVPLIGLPGQPALGARRLPARRRAAGADASRASRRRRRSRPRGRGWRATCRAPRAGSTSSRSSCATAWRRRGSAPRRCSGRWRAPTATSSCRSPTRGCPRARRWRSCCTDGPRDR